MAIFSPIGNNTIWGLPLQEFHRLDDERFAAEWKYRYLLHRARLLPDIARWIRLLRFFHPRALQDHWQDSFGNPLPKLRYSSGLSVEIYNWCRPIIEVYGSLLAGQKPLPFTLNVPPLDPDDPVMRAQAAAQQKLLKIEMYEQRIPLHFMDFCISVVLFGIGYVMSWIDSETRRLKTQAIPWPGDVLPEWGSDRYGRGAEALESVILTERMPVETATRLYPDVNFQSSMIDLSMRPDGTPQMYLQVGSTQVLKCWWRWDEFTKAKKRKPHVAYAEIAFTGTQNSQPAVLYREDDTGYPDIPVRWASRFTTPGEAPHRSAGILDDIVGLNTEYNEKFSAMADYIMKAVYIKYKAKGFTIANVPQLREGSNMYPMGMQQDIIPLVDQIAPHNEFDTFLTRMETMMLTGSGLSRLLMGSVPPGSNDSGEALSILTHASVGRLEVVRTPIQWAWTTLIDDVWVPLSVKYSHFTVKDTETGKPTKVSLKPIFENYNHVEWQWPDVTPRDQIKAVTLAMNLGKGGWLSDEGVMARANIANPVDEMERIRQERQDIILHPEFVKNTATAEESLRMLQIPPGSRTMTRVTLKSDLSPQGLAGEEQRLGLVPPMDSAQQAMAGPMIAGQLEKLIGQTNDMNNKMLSQRTPVLSESDNERSPAPGQTDTAIEGAQGGMR